MPYSFGQLPYYQMAHVIQCRRRPIRPAAFFLAPCIGMACTMCGDSVTCLRVQLRCEAIVEVGGHFRLEVGRHMIENSLCSYNVLATGRRQRPSGGLVHARIKVRYGIVSITDCRRGLSEA
jgi:hypothetical protein